MLEEIFDISDRAFQLMESILAAKTLSPGPHTLMSMPVELGSWLQAALEDFMPQAENYGIHLAFDLPTGPMLVQIDPLMFRRVIDNLISNALKYTPQGGRITVSGKLLGDSIELRISDTGIGIPQGQLPNLLSESWQIRREGLRGESSHGLGLSVVQDIVLQHQALLNVESKEGIGTSFIITLPLMPANTFHPSSQPSPVEA
ncbi:MAG: hypothetical protein CVV27_18635 [Candidatus Melainabacteria bacterium HGW-Melainabacteria-1]|nr:MAG: hypothetical protein CVV27_18635 [Candidatus Melainabacteria bacterium HGW-Melainabacteria-1]